MSSWASYLANAMPAILLLLAPGSACAASDSAAIRPLGLGQPISESSIAPWNIDAGPDGVGLPKGRGTAAAGEPVYLIKCAACHGEFGEGIGRFPALVADGALLTDDRPEKTVGNYWPYATTLWDYINRAMPFGNAQSLNPNEVYSLVAYILSMNEIIDDDQEMNAESLPRVEMPNRNGFITAREPDIRVRACMHNCLENTGITSRANRNSPDSESE